jgi:hypothetical protein
VSYRPTLLEDPLDPRVAIERYSQLATRYLYDETTRQRFGG